MVKNQFCVYLLKSAGHNYGVPADCADLADTGLNYAKHPCISVLP